MIGALVSVPMYRAKKKADETANRLLGVDKSVAALEAALARGDMERAALQRDRDGDRERFAAERDADRERFAGELHRLRREIEARDRRCDEHIQSLAEQVRKLGGHPNVGRWAG